MEREGSTVSLLGTARGFARRVGVDVHRWPDPTSPHVRLIRLLDARGVSVVLDVGANVGQYASALRRNGFAGRIVSFEPAQEQYRWLEKAARDDTLWTAVHCAVGASTEPVTLNVAANAGASSSVLPMLARHAEAAPLAVYVGTEEVPQRQLDELVDSLGVGESNRVFLKIDVQGYERHVLEGAVETLRRAVGVQLELSLVPLYEGGMLYREAIDFMNAHGFELKLIEPGFWDRETGEDLQVDGIFFRSADA